MDNILKKLNNRKYVNESYSVVKKYNFYVIKQYRNGIENKYFDVKYTSKSDVIKHLKNILKYDIF